MNIQIKYPLNLCDRNKYFNFNKKMMNIKKNGIYFKYRESASLREKHDSKSGTDGSGWEVGIESSQYSTSVSVCSADASPYGLH